MSFSLCWFMRLLSKDTNQIIKSYLDFFNFSDELSKVQACAGFLMSIFQLAHKRLPFNTLDSSYCKLERKELDKPMIKFQSFTIRYIFIDNI